MELSEYIENKKNELVESKTYKSSELGYLENCKLSRNCTSVEYNIDKNIKINTDIEIEEVDRWKLENNVEIDAIQVVFYVVKPRCRKPVRYEAFVKVI